MEMSGDVVVERLWDDGAPVNKTTIALNKGFAKYTFTPDVAHINSTLNLVVCQCHTYWKICTNINQDLRDSFL